jgi:hypothetical protein
MVKVDKDRTRDVFASNLSGKGLIRAALTNFLGKIGIDISTGGQAMLKQNYIAQAELYHHRAV